MTQYLIKFKSNYGTGSKIIESDCKRNAMKNFNEKYRSSCYEIKEVEDLSLINKRNREESMNQDKGSSMSLQEYRDLKVSQKNELDKMSLMLDKTNDILFEQLEHFKNIDPSDEKMLGLEKAKNDSLSGLAKTLVQSTSIKAMIDSRKCL